MPMTFTGGPSIGATPTQGSGLTPEQVQQINTATNKNNQQDETLGTLDQRVTNLENSTGGTDYSAQIADLQAKDASQDQTISDVDAKADSTAANTLVLDQRITTLESNSGGIDYSAQITAIETKNTEQDTRLSAAETSLGVKADLVAGKVPLNQLPDIPVGRKVNVANRVARLALSSYADLTIAYESDTGDAYGLDANANPAIDSNWSKLGNSLGVGVASFNGRTGNIGPQTGDYSTNQISETTNKRFVTGAQITQWTNAATATAVTTFNGRSGVVVPVSGDYTADLVTETTNRKWLTPTQITSWDAKETTIGAQTKATTAQTDAVASAKNYADTTFTPLTQKGAANGIATLNASSKIPVAQLPTNVADGVVQLDSSGKVANAQLNRAVANGIAPLDANSRVPAVNLPTFLPQTKRIWREVKGSRVVGTYYKNVSGNEQIVRVRHKATVTTGRYTQIVVRASQATQWFEFNTIKPSSLGSQEEVMAIVPTDWEYAVSTNGGTTDINLIDAWYEMY